MDGAVGEKKEVREPEPVFWPKCAGFTTGNGLSLTPLTAPLRPLTGDHAGNTMGGRPVHFLNFLPASEDARLLPFLPHRFHFFLLSLKTPKPQPRPRLILFDIEIFLDWSPASRQLSQRRKHFLRKQLGEFCPSLFVCSLASSTSSNASIRLGRLGRFGRLDLVGQVNAVDLPCSTRSTRSI